MFIKLAVQQVSRTGHSVFPSLCSVSLQSTRHHGNGLLDSVHSAAAAAADMMSDCVASWQRPDQTTLRDTRLNGSLRCDDALQLDVSARGSFSHAD